MRNRTSRSQAGGFAMIVALTMIGMVGAAVLSLTVLLRDQFSQTRSQVLGAQLRQMLNAGAAGLPARVRDPMELTPVQGQRSWEVPLPASLLGQRGSVTLQEIESPSGGLERRIRVTARLGGQAQQQTLRYVRLADGWALAEAFLGK